MSEKYGAILRLPHKQSYIRPHMVTANRAAQFAAFAALSGYGEAILEAARTTEERKELDEYEVSELNSRLKILDAHLDEAPEVGITYFQPDNRKAGGAYLEYFGFVKSIDKHSGFVIMGGGEEIPMADIIRIDSSLFDPYFL